ncbi:MAG: AAA family ATPase [Pseudobdellovibrionaceae bacterium]
MLQSIQISKVATYQGADQHMNDLRKVNFVFGCNGTGKTTISRIIAEPEKFPTCPLGWKSGISLLPMVYNRDFVDRNFRADSDLKGVFTLGEDGIETLKQIETLKKKEGEFKSRITNLQRQLRSEDGASGKEIDVLNLENKFKEDCWKLKVKFDADFQGAFEGLRNSKDKFRDRVLHESKNNQAELIDLEVLKGKAQTVFGETPLRIDLIPAFDTTKILGHETNPILKKRVIGKDDVSIAAMIKKLGNSDWVRQGRSFYDANDGACPFCQQQTEEAFAKALDEYFDETFEADTKSIDDLYTNYKTDCERLQAQMDSIVIVQSKFLDIEKIKAEYDLFNSKVLLNYKKLEEKKKEPSGIVDLDSVSNVLTVMAELIKAANTKTEEHNALIDNIGLERTKLTGQVWKFILNEFGGTLQEYLTKSKGLATTISSVKSALDQAEKDLVENQKAIADLEKTCTSIQPTLDGMNRILKSFGFTSFSLQMGDDQRSYRLLRENGECAKDSLSEGEKSFVTFLYFYHLLQGSNASGNITSDRIVVFDDPVSSLDSDVLFIVSSLIRRVCKNVKEGSGYIKQVFILTHNVFFHKEVSFQADAEEGWKPSYWIVKKSDKVSKIDSFPKNPISTSYELLWDEIRAADPAKAAFLPNAMRRILEHYFKILGGFKLDALQDKFEGSDKIVCKSLLSWVNAGSHSVLDDTFVSDVGVSGEVYLRVFKEIFEKYDHSAHYKMMMKINELDAPVSIQDNSSPEIKEAA